ncbi:Outer membrane protein (porin) [Formivibrio citricus]|uniref:Outer membrane protein (Porin) n=1 Tax=Formivibrio citricus TaxID=83765 RepID=A0A1I4WXC2_9NEIS|nr:porin [Formivibrio citricus]SFN17760.1 Outer membrane protein (porin) [Formivibrio citricus]
MKKIIALAVASAFVAPAVMAEAVIYGSLRPHVEYSKITDNSTNDLTKTRLVDDVSRIGFKGTDKLDNGLQLFWQVENRIHIGAPNSTSGFNSRDSFVGVRGNFGEVSVGKISDLTDDFVGILPGLDYWNGANASAYIFATHGDTARLPNAALYSSPVFFGGLQAKALYDFGKKTTTANYQGYQGELTYSTKLFKVGGVYKQNNDTANNGDSGTATLGAENYYKSYILGANITPVDGFDISVMWDRKKTRTAGVEARQDAWAVGASYLTGKHGIGVQYAKMGDIKNGSGTSSSDTGAYALVAQYKYSLSKQTTAIAAIGRTRNDNNAAFSMHSDSLATIGNGAKITTISAGVRTDF